MKMSDFFSRQNTTGSNNFALRYREKTATTKAPNKNEWMTECVRGKKEKLSDDFLFSFSTTIVSSWVKPQLNKLQLTAEATTGCVRACALSHRIAAPWLGFGLWQKSSQMVGLLCARLPACLPAVCHISSINIAMHSIGCWLFIYTTSKYTFALFANFALHTNFIHIEVVWTTK